ncbi:MAG TPA: FxSxx-COOH system tetratricopeptide repeat protein [Ktedonobacteraceae bacterium]|nr:FxSxx-COOH system tetratricopeptide repeat protein [Ktedonobacteraceae bacterium]
MNRNMTALFGDLLNSFRTRRRLTQNSLAASLGIHRNTIGRWERGEVLPDAKGIVLELARLLTLSEAETRLLLEASLTPVSPHWTVPFPRNPLFTGREAILEQLRAQLVAPRSGTLAPTLALSGMGGIGKTQIAIEFAYRNALEFSAVFWVAAETAETVITSLQQIAEFLQLPASRSAEQLQIVGAVQRWLHTHQGWLLIGDNVEDMDVLHEVLPPNRQGALLLTTRHQAPGLLAQPIAVPSMSQSEGVTLLLQRARQPVSLLQAEAALSPQQSQTVSAAERLVDLLDGLPLALDQAGAYIDESSCSVAEYVRRFQQQRRWVLAHRGLHGGAHPASVFTTLTMAVDHIEQENQMAANLLRVCAFLHPEGIPEEMFTEGPSHVAAIVANSHHFDLAVIALRSASLIAYRAETRTFSLHRLVQAVLREQMEPAEAHLWSAHAIRVVNAIFPEPIFNPWNNKNWSTCERYLIHALACLSLIDQVGEEVQEAGELLLKIGSYLLDRGRNEEASPLLERAVAFSERQGSTHLSLTYCLTKQGELLWFQGKHLQAEQVLYRALAIGELHLGPFHEHIIIILGDLASVLRDQEKYDAADVLYQQVWNLLEKRWGPEHLEIAELCDNRAILYWNQGKDEQAEVLYRQALNIQEKQLGSNHPRVAITLNNLATLYREQGNYEKAEPLYQRALRIREEQLGMVHPGVATSLRGLALVWRKQGRYKEAEPLYQRALLIREETQGSEHPSTVLARNDLTSLYGDLGRYEEAESVYQRALSSQEEEHGPEYPGLASLLVSFGNLYRNQKKYQEAESLYTRALTIQEQDADAHQVGISAALHGMAELYADRGNSQEAILLYRRALAIRENMLGLSHSQTTSTRKQLCALLGQTEQGEEGEAPNG